MIYVHFKNNSINFEYDVPVEEEALQELVKTGVPETINPEIESWLLEWNEAKEVMESIASLIQEPVQLVVHQFLRLVELFEKKGAVIVNNKYKDSEQFLKVFKKYVKQFNFSKGVRSFSPDMAITTLACLVALKFQNLELELPEECLKYYLNILEEVPETEGAGPDVPPNGIYKTDGIIPNPES